MRINLHRDSLDVIPDSLTDEVFLEMVLGLKKEGDTVQAKRVAPMGLPLAWAYLEIKKAEVNDE